MQPIFFFFNDTATTEIYTLSLHDALPILSSIATLPRAVPATDPWLVEGQRCRSEEHTSELQSQSNLVCRLLLEKKKIHYFRLTCVRSSYLYSLAYRYPLSSELSVYGTRIS